MTIDCTVPCPECHRSCGWCAWYAKNAREAGCGCPRSPRGRTVTCAWGEALKAAMKSIDEEMRLAR